MTPRDWRDARVLVTGARGFIATALCRRLIDAGAIVHGVSSRAPGAGAPGIEWWQLDLTDLPAVRQLLNHAVPDIIFHLAGHVTGSTELPCVQSTLAMNLISTVQLLTAAAERKATRVVLAGSMQVPNADEPLPVFSSPYAVSKWACTGYARLFHDLYDVPVATARLMMVYGPGQWDLDKLLPYVTVSLLKGEPPAVGNGTREMDWVFVDDVVQGLMAVAVSPMFDAQSVDLGTGTLTSNREIIQHVVALLGSDVPVRFGARPDRRLERPRVARAEETRRLIGWSATTPLREGLRQTVAWYRERWCPQPA